MSKNEAQVSTDEKSDPKTRIETSQGMKTPENDETTKVSGLVETTKIDNDTKSTGASEAVDSAETTSKHDGTQDENMPDTPVKDSYQKTASADFASGKDSSEIAQKTAHNAAHSAAEHMTSVGSSVATGASSVRSKAASYVASAASAASSVAKQAAKAYTGDNVDAKSATNPAEKQSAPGISAGTQARTQTNAQTNTRFDIRAAWVRYFATHRNTVVDGTIAVLIALCILVFGFFPTLLVVLFGWVGTLIGRYRDGDPHIINLTRFIRNHINW